MKQEQAALLMMKGAIADMPADEQAKIHEAADKIRAVIRDAGQHGEVAMSLVAIEFAAND